MSVLAAPAAASTAVAVSEPAGGDDAVPVSAYAPTPPASIVPLPEPRPERGK
jgi:hypothetical protein